MQTITCSNIISEYGAPVFQRLDGWWGLGRWKIGGFRYSNQHVCYLDFCGCFYLALVDRISMICCLSLLRQQLMPKRNFNNKS